MARYSGPVCRLCRRNGTKLFLKGERCFTPRCGVERRKSPPGEQGTNARRRRPSEHAEQLREKQKARNVYGVLERQFVTYVVKAGRMSGITGMNLLQVLERRLDNVVYRLGFSDSRPQARQWVGHGHLKVNGRRVNIPSFLVKAGDVVSWREESKDSEMFKVVCGSLRKRRVPGWLTLDESEVQGTVVSLPEENDFEANIDTRLIVEFYSRR